MTYQYLSNFNITANFDYINRAIKYSMTTLDPAYTGFTNGFTFRLFDENGLVVNYYTTGEYFKNSAGAYGYVASSPFGIDLSAGSQNYLDGGIDKGYITTDLSGVTVGVAGTNWEMSNDTTTLEALAASAATRVTELAFSGLGSQVLDRRNNQYIDTPLLITRGDAVLQGKIATVGSRNQITITTDRVPASYTGYNLDNCLVQIISGSNSGEVFSITSHTAGSTTLYADKNCYGYSGQAVKIMPYRIITSYSGYLYNSPSAGNNKGSGGLNARFGLNETIPNKIGTIAYTQGTYSGMAKVDHMYGLYGIPVYSGAVCTLAKDTYHRDVLVGDIVYYNPAASPASTYTGVVIRTDYASATGSSFAITIWPGVPVYSDSAYAIYRCNQVKVLEFPEPSKTYTVTAVSNQGNSGVVHGTASTPEMYIDFSANEFENVFNNVQGTSHFHIGPIQVSNGQVIDDSTNTLPLLWCSGTVYNGDPNSPSTVLSKTAFATQSTNTAVNFDGSFHKDGVFTYAVATSFNASETLTCKVQMRYGSIKLLKTITIPVQPSV